MGAGIHADAHATHEELHLGNTVVVGGVGGDVNDARDRGAIGWARDTCRRWVVGAALSKHEQTLIEVLEKAPEQAVPALGRALERSKYGREEIKQIRKEGQHPSDSTPGPVNETPTVSISSPANDSTFVSEESVDFVGTASDTEDDDVVLTASLVWTSDIDGQIFTGGSFSTTTLSDGIHTITASVIDSGDAMGSATIRITVGNPPDVATTVSVVSITYATDGGKNKDKHLNITFALLDDSDSPVAGASVSINLYLDGPFLTSGTGITGSNGTVTFTLKNAKSGCYSTTATNVTATGLNWIVGTPTNEFCKPG